MTSQELRPDQTLGYMRSLKKVYHANMAVHTPASLERTRSHGELMKPSPYTVDGVPDQQIPPTRRLPNHCSNCGTARAQLDFSSFLQGQCRHLVCRRCFQRESYNFNSDYICSVCQYSHAWRLTTWDGGAPVDWDAFPHLIHHDHQPVFQAPQIYHHHHHISDPLQGNCTPPEPPAVVYGQTGGYDQQASGGYGDGGYNPAILQTAAATAATARPNQVYQPRPQQYNGQGGYSYAQPIGPPRPPPQGADHPVQPVHQPSWGMDGQDDVNTDWHNGPAQEQGLYQAQSGGLGQNPSASVMPGTWPEYTSQLSSPPSLTQVQSEPTPGGSSSGPYPDQVGFSHPPQHQPHAASWPSIDPNAYQASPDNTYPVHQAGFFG